jgi:murein DD-endopeptidase MepM/ murein hydrolase activator NlpD
MCPGCDVLHCGRRRHTVTSLSLTSGRQEKIMAFRHIRISAPVLACVLAVSAGSKDALPAGTTAVAGVRMPSVPAFGTYAWPVRGQVIRPFEEPSGPYGPGHRGIDIAAPFGTTFVAAQDGVVAFAGWVAGSLFLSIDHPDGVRTTYSWLSDVQVTEGDVVARGEPVGSTGSGHPGSSQPHLHFGARIGDTYIDPMLLLEGDDVSGLIHLAELTDDSGRSAWGRTTGSIRSLATRDPRRREGSAGP